MGGCSLIREGKVFAILYSFGRFHNVLSCKYDFPVLDFGFEDHGSGDEDLCFSKASVLEPLFYISHMA